MVIVKTNTNTNAKTKTMMRTRMTKKGQVCFLGTPGGARSKVGNKWEQDKQSQRGRIMLWSDERKTPKNGTNINSECEIRFDE